MAIHARRLFIIASMLPTIGRAQGKLLAHTGDRVRVFAPESGFETITGRVVSADSALLTIRVYATPGLFYVHRADIEAIDISARTRTFVLSGMVAGALNGVLLGLGVGSMEAVSGPPQRPGYSPERHDAILGGAAGIVAGGIVGLLCQRDDWVPVQITASEGSNPSASRAAISSGRITLRWSVSY